MELKDFLDFGPFRADMHKRVLLRENQPVQLPGKAFDVLVVLLQNAGTTVSKDEILKIVWPGTFVEEGNLTQTVFLLRKALGDSDSQPYIVTVPRQGYRFVGTVTGNTAEGAIGTLTTELSPTLWQRHGKLILATAASVAVLGVLAVVILRPPPFNHFSEPVRFEIPFENRHILPLLSPDGKRIALVPEFQTQSQMEGIWIHNMNGTTPYLLAGTENTFAAFWSPDGCCLGFMAQGKLKTINVTSGPPKVLADASNGRGGAWNSDGTIIFAPGPDTALHSIPAAGGVPAPVSTVDTAKNQNSHRWPVFLPGGKKFIFLAQSSIKENMLLNLGELGKMNHKPLIRSDSNPSYVPQTSSTGLLFYVVNQTLMAHPFNHRSGELTGQPSEVAKSIGYGAPMKIAHFSAARGIIVYRSGVRARALLHWFSRSGEDLGAIAGSEGLDGHLYLSRDGNLVAGSKFDLETSTGDIWTVDLIRGGVNRITRHPAWESSPVLSPDNKEIIFASDRPPSRNAYLKAVEGSSAERPLIAPSEIQTQRNPHDWSSDGRFILYATVNKLNEDLWVFDTSTKREYPLVATPFNESLGQFTSDSKWVAYTSDETGRPEIYVREFLAPDKLADQRTRISVDGGTEPRWRQDGKELFYVGSGGEMMAVAIQPGAPLRAGKPTVLFAGKLGFGFGWHSTFNYAASGNGQKFLMPVFDKPVPISPFTVLLNWNLKGAN